jgi:hypothetical protein
MRILTLTAVLCVLVLTATPADARPFRAMVTRTAETTDPGKLELGLRYQGFFAGRDLNALPYHQLSPGVRLGIIDGLELNFYLDLMMLGTPGSSGFTAYLGDVPIGLQFTFIDTRSLGLGLWVRGTVPVGAATFDGLPSSLADRIPPSLSDGTWDAEGTLVAEFRLTEDFRIMGNLGLLHHGVRGRGTDSDFDVPSAIRYDVAATLNIGDWILLGLELLGRSYLDPRITPAWDNNAHQLELLPSVRLEVVPNLVLEAALGFAASPDLQEMYFLRGLLGLTYEFDLGGGRGDGRRRSKRRGR